MRKHHSFSWKRDDELHPELELALHEAVQRGYSVIELSRILGNSASRNLYGMMRDAGLIAKLPKGRTPKVEIHPGLAKALEERELSFNRWVNSHDLNPVDVATALVNPLDEKDPRSIDAHRIFRQDFRHLYCKVYSLPAEPDLASSAGPASRVTDYNIMISPDKENDRYKAFIVEMPECCGYGYDRDDAYFAVKSRYVLFHSIRKLRVLPDKRIAE